MTDGRTHGRVSAGRTLLGRASRRSHAAKSGCPPDREVPRVRAIETTGRIVVESMPEIDPDEDLFNYGLADAVYVPPVSELDCLPRDHPALFAWDRLQDEVRQEVGPAIARLVTEAYRRRLPWAWESDEGA